MRVRRGGSNNTIRREESTDSSTKRMRANFSFRRVSEVMEGVRLQGMRATVSKTNLQVRNLAFEQRIRYYGNLLCV